MCKVGIIQWVMGFEEAEVVGGKGGGGEECEEEKKKGEKTERDKKGKIGVEKGK
jgi:hypothetical protein